MIDTDPEVERRLIEIYRQMPMQEKWRQLGTTFEAAKQLAAAGTRLRNPHASAAEIHEDWLIRTDGRVPIDARRKASDAAC
jgi:hypothetical protein